jgi:hypothetical protein
MDAAAELGWGWLYDVKYNRLELTRGNDKIRVWFGRNERIRLAHWRRDDETRRITGGRSRIVNCLANTGHWVNLDKVRFLQLEVEER